MEQPGEGHGNGVVGEQDVDKQIGGASSPWLFLLFLIGLVMMVMSVFLLVDPIERWPRIIVGSGGGLMMAWAIHLITRK